MHHEASVADEMRPLAAADVPFGERHGLGLDDQVVVAAGVADAHLGVVAVEDQPETVVRWVLVGEVEANLHASIRQAIDGEVSARPGLEEEAGVAGRGVQPEVLFCPVSHREQDRGERHAGVGRMVRVAVSVRFGDPTHDAGSLEVAESSYERRAGESGRAVELRGEGVGAADQVAQDDRRPRLGQDLCGTGDRAVLAVAAHTSSLATPRRRGKFDLGTGATACAGSTSTDVTATDPRQPVGGPSSVPAAPTPSLAPALHHAYRAVLADTDVRLRQIGSGHRLLERGGGPPVLLIHGTRDPSPMWVPLMTSCEGVRLIAPDRPQAQSRTDAVAWVDGLLDALGLDSTAIVGHSAGGLWGLWYALARPGRVDHLVIVGSPALPGTTVPLPYRVVATPGLGRLVVRRRATRSAVRRFATMMGEGDAIERYPALIDLLVAVGNDRRSVDAGRDEAQQLIVRSALLRRHAFRSVVDESDLRALRVPTTLVWGTRDPVGTAEVADALASTIPCAELRLLEAGHVPWFAEPEAMGALVARIASTAVRSRPTTVESPVRHADREADPSVSIPDTRTNSGMKEKAQ